VTALSKHAARILLVLLVGGLLGAILVRVAPGYGSGEEDLDMRLSASTQLALRAARQGDSNLFVLYYRYWSNLLRGDLGTSVALHEPVRALLCERSPETLKNLACGLVIAWSLGLGLAFSSIGPRPHLFNAAGRLMASSVLCLPAAVLTMMLVLFHAPARIAVGLIVFPKVFQFSRTLLLRCAAMPHVLAARAKGLAESAVLRHHVLRVAAPQLMALLGVSLCMALGACIPVEVVGDLPGIGQLAWQAASNRDLPLLLNLTLLVTLTTLIANSMMEALGGAVRRDLR
jgi:peptide/nickel transport system permease protein